MYDSKINPTILEEEIDSFLKRIAAYRSRLVLKTCRADHNFQLGVFGFQHFMGDFTKSLQPSEGLDMVDVLEVNNRILMRRAQQLFDPGTEADQKDLARIEALCANGYEAAPQSGKRGRAASVEAAKAAIGNYLEASLLVFYGDMREKGFSGGVEDVEELFVPIKFMLRADDSAGQRLGLAPSR